MLQDFIKASGRTQAHWASAFGVSTGFLSTLVSRRKMPSLELAVRIERMTQGAVPVASWVASPDRNEPAAAGQDQGVGVCGFAGHGADPEPTGLPLEGNVVSPRALGVCEAGADTLCAAPDQGDPS